jgi:asparagine synthase (glutamine-hydrolysing)
MAASLRHRGPDDSGTYRDEEVALINRRLSIVDVEGGRQPLHNESATIHLVCNGEIYNHGELRRQLESSGHQFATRSDVEVILHLYEEHGVDCLGHLNGMFAFALWDAEQRKGLIARDRLGIKPLYYGCLGPSLVFGSEIKAVLAVPGVRRELNADALDQYLVLRYVPGSVTIFQGIHKILPGHAISFDADAATWREWEYWSPQCLESRQPCTVDEAAEEVRALLADSVRLRLMSDVPFGAFLSGGLDSSGIVALMSRAMSEPVRTFSIGFSEQHSLDERSHAQVVSRHCSTEHSEIDCTADKVELLPRLLHHFDEPFADPIIVPTFQVAELAARDVKVVLTGEGADELFGGYTRFVTDQMIRRLGRLPAPARGIVRALGGVLPSEPARAFVSRALRLSALPVAARSLSWVTAFDSVERGELYSAAKATSGARDLYEACMSELTDADDTASMMYAELRIRLPECMLARTDRMTMAVSLEGRTPFLDHRLVEYVLALPHHMKVRGRTEKYVLKHALAGVLPDSIIRRRKQGLAVPFAMWTRYGVDASIRRILSPRNVERRGIFDSVYVQELLTHWGPHSARHSQLIWSLLCFELWCRMYLDSERLAPNTPLSEVA